MRWQRLICLVAFHKWVRRRTPGDDSGSRQECVRCGAINERADVDPRVQGL
jgi:hypothetical protein